jgi:predicted exporter
MSTNPMSSLASALGGTAERRIAAVAVAVALGAGVIGFRSWLEERDDRAQLRALPIGGQRVDERFRLERGQVVRPLAKAHQLDGNAKLPLHGDDDAALGRAI